MYIKFLKEIFNPLKGIEFLATKYYFQIHISLQPNVEDLR